MGCKVKELRFGLHKCRTPVDKLNILMVVQRILFY